MTQTSRYLFYWRPGQPANLLEPQFSLAKTVIFTLKGQMVTHVWVPQQMIYSVHQRRT